MNPTGIGKFVLWMFPLFTLAVETRGLSAEPIKLDSVPSLSRSAVGVTRKGTAIECWLSQDDWDLGTKRLRVLVIGGLAGEQESVEAVRSAVHRFYTSPEAAALRERLILSAIPSANPDGVAGGVGPSNGSGGNPTRGYPPPKDAFYSSANDPEAAYLWRWIGMHAPDLVVEVRSQISSAGDELVPQHDLVRKLTETLDLRSARAPSDALVVQLQKAPACETGTIPTIQIVAENQMLLKLLAALDKSGWTMPSPARRELQSRLDRTPLQVAQQLSQYYGHALPDVAYIPAVAMIGRLRFGELARDARQQREVEHIAAPFFRGEKVPKDFPGNVQSGHLIFCELADRTEGDRRARYIELAKAAADLAFDEQGRPREAMPHHLEMSDSLFMGGPILAYVGALTGDARYFDACLRHLRFMRGLCLRADGLYRHSPLDEAAWGRGNGFPALGVAWSLSHFPVEHPGRAELLAWFRAHMRALLAHQDGTGCWHQVVDRPESYRELTATCMIGFAMARGIRAGWLEKDPYQPAVDRAWYAVKTRIASDGRLVDVCTGTGKQKSLRDYYDRPAILGKDDRGGAMALLFATELARTASGKLQE